MASRHKGEYGNKHWFPNVINTWQEIWSQRYDYVFTHTEVVPLFWSFLFGFFTFCDLLTSFQDILYGIRQKYWTAAATNCFPVTLEVPCAVKLVDMWDCVL